MYVYLQVDASMRACSYSRLRSCGKECGATQALLIFSHPKPCSYVDQSHAKDFVYP